MSDNKSIGKRENSRTQVVPNEIKGLLTREDKDHQQPFLIWDVSLMGLGLWTSDALTPGDKLRITIGQPYLLMIEGEVVWCEPHTGGEGFRCGVQVVDNDKKLTSLFRAFTQIEEGNLTDLIDRT